MRTLTLLAILTLSAVQFACAGHSSPTAPAPGTALRSIVTSRAPAGAQLFAPFQVALDPGSLSAVVTPTRVAVAQPPQGQRYDLDIANFQNVDSLRITGVTVLGSGNFRLTFSHAHPFPAPNVANPATGTNRADLGYTGRLLVLTEYNPQSFFSGAVRLSAGAVVGADGYVEPLNLLANRGLSLVTAYPFILLADEAEDNRDGISNGGDPGGSYAPTAGGWQRVNLGVAGTGWTGYDYVHGGQTITNQLTLSRAALEASNFALDVALLIQYTDPRGHGGAVDRLPGVGIDVANFAYRLPYAALDCSKITFTAPLTLTSAVGNSATLEVRIRDWDAGATEASDATVGDESDVALVQAGASGMPAVVLDAPGILTGLRNMGTPTGTGLSDDPLVYSNVVVNQEDATSGEYFACLRIVDPEDDDTARDTYHFGVDPDTLLPSASRAIPARTWQVVPITVTPALAPPVITGVTPTGIVGAVDEFLTFEATVSGTADTIDWSFAPEGVRSVEASGASATVQFAGMQGTYEGSVTASNAAGSSAPFNFSFRTLPPIKPHFSNMLLAVSTVLQGRAEDQIVTVIDGRPAVLYTDSGTTLRIAHANVPEPVGSQWSYYQIATGIQGGLAVAQIDARCTIAAAQTGATGHGLYIYATTATPMAAGDWRVTNFRDAVGDEAWGYQNALAEYDGRAILLTREDDLDHFYYFRADGPNPLGDADWESMQLTSAGVQGDLAVVDFPEGPRPVAAVASSSLQTVALYSAKVAEPDVLADWQLTERLFLGQVNSAALPDYAPGIEPGLVPCAVIVGSGTASFLSYLEFRGDSASTLALREDQTIASGPLWFANSPVKMIWHNERLALIYNNGILDRPAIIRALTQDPYGSDWQEALLPVEATTSRVGMISHANALFVVADTSTVANWRWFAADGPW